MADYGQAGDCLRVEPGEYLSDSSCGVSTFFVEFW